MFSQTAKQRLMRGKGSSQPLILMGLWEAWSLVSGSPSYIALAETKLI